MQQLRRAGLCIPPSLKVGEHARAGRQLHVVTVSHRLAICFCHPPHVASISGSKETAVLFSSQHEEGRRKSPGKQIYPYGDDPESANNTPIHIPLVLT